MSILSSSHFFKGQFLYHVMQSSNATSPLPCWPSIEQSVRLMPHALPINHAPLWMVTLSFLDLLLIFLNVTLGKQDLLLDLLDAHLFLYIFNIIPYAFIPRLQVVPHFSQAIVEGIKYCKLSLIRGFRWSYKLGAYIRTKYQHTIFEITRLFNLQNVVKNRIHFSTS